MSDARAWDKCNECSPSRPGFQWMGFDTLKDGTVGNHYEPCRHCASHFAAIDAAVAEAVERCAKVAGKGQPDVPHYRMNHKERPITFTLDDDGMYCEHETCLQESVCPNCIAAAIRATKEGA